MERCAGTARCTVTYGQAGRPATHFRVRYAIAARSGSPTCWVAARAHILTRPSDPSVLDVLGVQDGPSEIPNGCATG